MDSSFGGSETSMGMIDGVERKELLLVEKMPVLSIFVIRHGETGKNKENPKRALTDNGESQVREATENALKKTILDAMPEGAEVDLNSSEVKDALSKLKFRLYDSGTTRTQQQIAIERDVLVGFGISEENIYLPKGYYEYIESEEKSGPGIEKRLEGVKGIDESPEFRGQISDPEYQKSVGASDEVGAWAQTPDDQVPAGVEKFSDVAQRVDLNIDSLRNIVPKLMKNNEKTIIFANSHASNVTIAAARMLNAENISDLGQAENAEGVRMAFYADGTEKSEPFGENYEEKAKMIMDNPE